MWERDFYCPRLLWPPSGLFIKRIVQAGQPAGCCRGCSPSGFRCFAGGKQWQFMFQILRSKGTLLTRYALKGAGSCGVRQMPLEFCGFLIENKKLKEVGEYTVLSVIDRSLWHKSDLRNLWHFYYLLLCYFYTEVLMLGNFWFLSKRKKESIHTYIYISHESCTRNEILGYMMSLNFSKS